MKMCMLFVNDSHGKCSYTTLYDAKTGKVWSRERIRAMIYEVVEETGLPKQNQYIANFNSLTDVFITKKQIKSVYRIIIHCAGRLMDNAGSCHTRADRAALANMVNRAKRALDGVKNPFTRNREFMNLGDAAEISFAYDRFTMAPTAFEKGKVYGHYGLKEAVRWFAAQDMAKWTQQQLEERRQEVLERVDTLLGQAVCGGQTGEYDRSVRDELERQRDILVQASGAGLPGALRSAVDAFHAMKFSRRLSSDKERYPVLLLSDGKRGELLGQIKSNALVRAQFQKIREDADMESLEESRIGYEQIWEQHGLRSTGWCIMRGRRAVMPMALCRQGASCVPWRAPIH